MFQRVREKNGKLPSKDVAGHTFATRPKNAFVIGTADETLVSRPKGKGISRNLFWTNVKSQ